MAFFSLARLNINNHVKNLFKTHICLVFLSYQLVDLMHRDFALNKELDLRLDMPIINVGTLFNIKLVSVMHDDACGPKVRLFVWFEFKPDHNWTVKAPFIS